MEDIIVKVFERLHGNESTTPGNLDTQAQRGNSVKLILILAEIYHILRFHFL